MCRSFYLIFIMLFAILMSATEIGDIENSDWYSSAIKNIKETEYYIKYNKKCNVYQSPNRSNNLRFTYYDNGFKVVPRDNSDEWDIEIRLESFGRDKQIQYHGKLIETDKNTMTVNGNGLDIEYINNKKGMRQNFIINERPERNGELELSFAIEGNNIYQITPDKITFKSNNQTVMEYKGLYIYDSEDNELDGRFIETDNGFKILISDTDAKYPITIDPLSTTPDWMGESNQAGAGYGYSVSIAGDVNGDGYSDVIVGAWRYDNGETGEGAAFVYYGSSTGLSTTYDWMGESNQTDAYYGRSVSSAGDVNGDGYSDIIVGAHMHDNGETDEGAAFVYHGSPAGLDTIPDWTGESNQAGACYGVSVSSAGDVNGDGYSDVIIGANRYDDGETDEGAAFVYYGSLSGLTTTPDWMGEANQANAEYGWSVSSAGDVNGDGYSDVITGAFRYDDGEANGGVAFVYHGSPAGLDTIPDWTGESNQASACYGVSVSSAGDVNADGFSDVIIGAHGYDNGQIDEGAAFVYYGSVAGLSTTYNWIGEGNQNSEGMGNYGYSVSTAGDVNRDGYSDIIVGAHMHDNGEIDEGAAFVYYGSETGLSTTYNWMGESDQDSSYYGLSVSSAGDVNGDGNEDIIIGAFGYNNGETGEGAAFLYYGRSPNLIMNTDSYNFGNIEKNSIYHWYDLLLSNIGNYDLSIDSMVMADIRYTIDSNYTYPITIAPTDSLNIPLSIESSDTGTIAGLLLIYHNEPGVAYDSVILEAHCGIPTIIDSAKAFDGVNLVEGIDDDDFVVLYFNQETNGYAIDASNINRILYLSNGHSWLDGFWNIKNSTWNSSNSALMIELSTDISLPTVSVGDTIYPDSSSIIGDLNGFLCHYPVVITGNFGLTGIANKELIDGGIAEEKSFLDVSINRLGYRVINPTNSIKIYDIAGKLIIDIENRSPGNYLYNTRDISSGIYFVIMKDGDRELNGRMTVVK